MVHDVQSFRRRWPISSCDSVLTWANLHKESFITFSLICDCFSLQVSYVHISKYRSYLANMLGTVNLHIHRANTPLPAGAQSECWPKYISRGLLDSASCRISGTNGPSTRGYVFWVWRLSNWRGGNPSAHIFIDGCEEFIKGSMGWNWWSIAAVI